MRVILKTLIALLILGLFGQQSIAQMSSNHSDQPRNIHSIKGDYFFDHQNFIKAIEYYSNSLREKPKDTYSMLRMAEAYHKSSEVDSANSWYQKALNLNSEIEASYLLKYIFFLLEQEKYDNAQEWSNIYHERIDIEVALNAENNVARVFRDTTIYIVKTLDNINSADADLDPLPRKDRLYFASDRFSSDELTVGAYNLYSSTSLPDDSFGEIEPFHKKINSELNEGPFAISKKTNTLYFTRNDELKGNAEAGMAIFYTDVPENENDKLKIKQLSFKNFDHNIGHPTLNSNGTVMYFIADDKKEERGYDLYKSEFTSKNWTTPQVLGALINTNGNEVYPFLHNDSTLYFASNGHKGLGGYDVYRVNVFDEKAQLEHLGTPVNTASDDFGLILKENTNQGFFSSNRSGGLGSYDVYGLDLMNLRLVEEKQETVKPVSISIFTSSGNEITLIGNSRGNFSFSIEARFNYSLSIDKVNYRGNTSTDATPDMNSGGSDETISTLELADGEMYNFYIEKFVQVEDGPVNGSREKKLQNILGNPGDLIAFRFMPNFSLPLKENVTQNITNIRYKYAKEGVNRGDTIVFGYVVEEMPKIVEPEPKMIASDEDTEVEQSLPQAEKMSDTTLLADNEAAKHIEEDLEAEKDNTLLPEIEEIIADPLAIIPQTKVQEMDSTIVSAESQKEDQPAEEVVEEVQHVDQELVLLLADNKSVDSVSNENEILEQQQVSLADSSEQIAGQADVALLIEDQPANHPETEPLPEEVKQSEELSQSAEDVEEVKTEDVEELKIEDDLQYRVQIAAARIKLDQTHLNSIYSGELKPKYSQEDGYYKYYIAQVPEVLVAMQIRDESGVDEAFVASYKGDVRQEIILLKLNQENEVPQTTMIDNELSKDSETEDDFQYRVQIVASKSKMEEAELKAKYSGDLQTRYFEEDGYFKYYIAQKRNYFAAKQILLESGVENGFIVAYEGGEKRVLMDAISAQYKERMIRDGIDVKDSIIRVITVNFNFDEFALAPDEKSNLQESVIDQLKNQHDHYAIVNGHTDIRGSDTYNFGLSEERALFVRKMIIDEGISAERVKTYYFGESKLAKDGNKEEHADESAHQANRRVEILLLTTKTN